MATILVVDDEEALRDCIRHKLVGLGHTVYEASGVDVLAVLEQCDDAIDVLIADVIMPRLNGIDLALGVLQRHPQAQIIFISGYDEKIMDRYPQAPKAVFLGKPFSLSQLANRVAALLTKGAGTATVLARLETNVFPSVQSISCDMDPDLPVRYFLDELEEPSCESYEEHFFSCVICARRVLEFFASVAAFRAALSAASIPEEGAMGSKNSTGAVD